MGGLMVGVDFFRRAIVTLRKSLERSSGGEQQQVR